MINGVRSIAMSLNITIRRFEVALGFWVLTGAFFTSAATDASDFDSGRERESSVSISTNAVFENECEHNTTSENTWNNAAIC